MLSSAPLYSPSNWGSVLELVPSAAVCGSAAVCARSRTSAAVCARSRTSAAVWVLDAACDRISSPAALEEATGHGRRHEGRRGGCPGLSMVSFFFGCHQLVDFRVLICVVGRPSGWSAEPPPFVSLHPQWIPQCPQRRISGRRTKFPNGIFVGQTGPSAAEVGF